MKLKIMDIDLLVPCRRFSIDYSYTDKRQLPILSEYVVLPGICDTLFKYIRALYC